MARIGAASALWRNVFGLAMVIERLNERALIVRQLGGAAPHAWAKALARTPLPGMIEAVAAKETLGLFFEQMPDPDAVAHALEGLRVEEGEPVRHIVPVCYAMGEDLRSAADALGLTTESLIDLHTSRAYRVDAIGFSPGFPYLSALDPRLSGLPRLPSPRPRVQKGSVGITGSQTCIYPAATPGGWNLIGVTPLAIVDRDSGYFPIQAGDEVVFTRIDAEEFERLEGARL